MKRSLAVLAVLAMVAAIPAISSAGPNTTECNGTIITTINGGLTVKAGNVCILNGATINGGIDMSGGQLLVCNSTVNGQIDVSGGLCVGLGVGSKDLDSENLAAYGLSSCPADTLNGHLIVENVSSIGAGITCPGTGDVEVEGSTLNGSVDINNNAGNQPPGPNNGNVELEDNSIHGTLKCSGNTTQGNLTNPINQGFTNTVTGNEKDQCAGL